MQLRNKIIQIVIIHLISQILIYVSLSFSLSPLSPDINCWILNARDTTLLEIFFQKKNQLWIYKKRMKIVSRCPICTACHRGLFYAVCKQHCFTRSYEARRFLADDNFLLKEKPFVFMTAIRACILLSVADNLSSMFVSALRLLCFLRALFHSHSRYISACIDYASSSLSDVLVSIGDRCGRNAHVLVFSTRIVRFPMPVQISCRIFAVRAAVAIDSRKKSPVCWKVGNLKKVWNRHAGRVHTYLIFSIEILSILWLLFFFFFLNKMI